MKRCAAFPLALFLAFPLPALAAGTLFGLPLSIQTDAEGEPLSGAKLYIYDANSSNPAGAFADYGLSEGQELSHPIEADSAGRLPQFWLADGAYRARLTTAAGVEVFDYASIQALGPSQGTGGGGSGAVDEQAVFDTGDFLWQPVSGTRAGWVRANGRTIGSASSGALERANADVGPLYEWLWNNFSDAVAPVTGGRGANAAADFAANKPIGTIDMRGRLMVGLDTMGTTAANVAAGVEDAAETGGDDTHTNTTGELAAHTHTGPSHAHGPGTFEVDPVATVGGVAGLGVVSGSSATVVSGGGAANVYNSISYNSIVIPPASVTGASAAEGTGPTGSAGTGTAYSIMNPYRAGTVYLKL